MQSEGFSTMLASGKNIASERSSRGSRCVFPHLADRRKTKLRSGAKWNDDEHHSVCVAPLESDHCQQTLARQTGIKPQRTGPARSRAISRRWIANIFCVVALTVEDPRGDAYSIAASLLSQHVVRGTAAVRSIRLKSYSSLPW